MTTTWQTALAAAVAGTGVARCLFVGDSVLEGEGASTRDNRSTAKFIAGTRSDVGLPTGGSGCILHYQATQLTDSAAWRNPLTASSGLSTDSNGNDVTQAQRGGDYNAVGDYAEFTVQGTDVDFLALQGTNDGGSFGVSVDGAAATTINTSTGSLEATTPNRIHLGASGSHTVKATLTAGLGASDGLIVYDGDATAGVNWLDCTRYGWNSESIQPQGTSYVEAYQHGWALYNPHLVIDNVTGIGDWGANTTLSDFEGYITSRMNMYKSFASNPTILMLLTYKIPSQVSGTNSNGNTVQDFHNAVTTIAAGYANAIVLDLNTVYPDFGTTTAWLASDAGHPSDTGHQMIANALVTALDPAPTDTTAPTSPTNLSIGSITQTGFEASWTASTDNVGVTGYEYQLDSGAITAAANPQTISGLTAGTTHQFQVRAYDAAGNRSSWTTTSVETESSETPPPTDTGNILWVKIAGTWLQIT